MKRYIIVLLVSLCCGNLLAQNSIKEQKAFENYEVFNFSRSLELYEKIGVQNVTTDGLRAWADIYKKRQQTEEAEVKYKLLIARSDHKPEDLFNYAQVLLMNNKPVVAEEYYVKYSDIMASDGRGREFKEEIFEYKKLAENSGRYQIFNLNENSDKEDFGPAFYGNKVVFTSSRSSKIPFDIKWNWNEMPYLNLFEANVEADHQLKEVQLLKGDFNKRFHDGPASFSKDGNFVVFNRNNYDEKSTKKERKLMMFSQTKDEKGNWGEVVPFNFNNKEYSVGQPFVTEDGKTIYFASDMPGGMGGTDLYKIELKDGNWTVPVNLGSKVNTEGNEMFPFYHHDKILFFASDGHLGIGGLDIFAVQVKNTYYYNRINLGYPINSPRDDFALILNNNQEFGYFSSNRAGGKGSDDIYSFNVLMPLRFLQEIEGTTVNKKGNVVPNATITVYDALGEEIEKLKSDSLGHFNLSLESGKYEIEGVQINYLDAHRNIDIPEIEKDAMSLNLVFESVPTFSLYALVRDGDSKKPLEGVEITLVNNINDESEDIVTPLSGDFTRPITGRKIGENISYQFILKKEGYLNKSLTYNKKLNKEGVYDATIELDFEMHELQIGKDLSKMIDIKPIYFDYDKFAIRPDAALELDKIVSIMNEYPDMEIELGSHTDCRGSAAYNLNLSDKRAKASADYIQSKITNPARIYGKGYGENKLVNGCVCEGSVKSKCSEDEHKENRRTEFRITKLNAAGVEVKTQGPQSFDK